MPSYKDIELDEEDDSFIPAAQRPEEQFKITHWQALQFLTKQINTYKQFKKFPRTHKSYKSLMYTGAMYEFIFNQLASSNSDKPNNP